jgi:hypothetical protein
VVKMNDPHVDALHYCIRHTDAVDYSKAVPLEYDKIPAFSVRIEDGNAKITMKEHFASIKAAREVVEPFLKTWELSWALDHPQEGAEFRYERASLVDRKSSPNVLSAEHISVGAGAMVLSSRVGRSKYPDPPSAMGWDTNVDVLFDRYRKFVEGRTTLSDAAYFCLTVLEAIPEALTQSKKKERKASPRKKAAAHFLIDVDVLAKIGELSSTKGGADARKGEGVYEAFTAQERAWLKCALKVLLRRAAQKVLSPQDLQNIRMNNLPPLED